VSWIKLASVKFYVRILVEFLLARFTLFVRTSENYWAVEVRFSEKKVRNAPPVLVACFLLHAEEPHAYSRPSACFWPFLRPNPKPLSKLFSAYAVVCTTRCTACCTTNPQKNQTVWVKAGACTRTGWNAAPSVGNVTLLLRSVYCRLYCTYYGDGLMGVGVLFDWHRRFGDCYVHYVGAACRNVCRTDCIAPCVVYTLCIVVFREAIQ